MNVILPGWALTPKDFEQFAKQLEGTSLIADWWRDDPSDIPRLRDGVRSLLAAPSKIENAKRTVTKQGLLIQGMPMKSGQSEAKLTLIGHSIGGLSALEWALRFPEDVGELILLDMTMPYSQAKSPAIPNLLVEFIQLIGAQTRRIWMAVRVGSDPLGAPERKKRYAEPGNIRRLAEHFRDSYDQQVYVAKLLKNERLAPHIKTKVVVAHGYFGRSWLRQQRALADFLGAELVTLPGHSHLFPLTYPRKTARAIFGA